MTTPWRRHRTLVDGRSPRCNGGHCPGPYSDAGFPCFPCWMDSSYLDRPVPPVPPGDG